MPSTDEPKIIKTTGRQPGTTQFRSGLKQPPPVAPSAALSGPASFDLVIFLWARRKFIIAITLFGALAGAIASFIVDPLFKSEVVMFPAVTNSASKSLLNNQPTGRDDILALGDEEDGEQLMQILQSVKIRDRVAEVFDLYEVYGIDEDDKHRQTELMEAYENYVSFERTRYGSIRVEVLDKDPVRAAEMANFIAAQVDTVWKEMAYERAGRGFELVKRKVQALEDDIAMMSDSMRILRQLGVHDYHTQTERYNEYLGAAILKGDRRAIDEIEERFKTLAEYGGAYVNLQDRLINDVERLSFLKMKMEMARADLEHDLPHKFVVNDAQPADKKSYPIRWLFVVLSGVSAFLLALLLIVVQENIKKVRPGYER